MRYQNFNRMANDQPRSIRHEMIEALCQVLDCTPNDLFKIGFGQPESL